MLEVSKASAHYPFVIPAQAGIQRSAIRMKQPAVYLMASQRNGTLYVGVTSDLIKRIWQHRSHVVEGFTEKYHVELLVWFEQHETMASAIGREKAIKKWNRAWKLNLIEKSNPEWLDMWPVITGEALDSRLRGNDNSADAAIPAKSSPVSPASTLAPASPASPASPVTPVTPAPTPVIPAPTSVIPAQAGIQRGPGTWETKTK